MKKHPKFTDFKNQFGDDWKEPDCLNYNKYQNEIVLEYWSKTAKKLTLFLEIDGCNCYLKSWGFRIIEDMEDGEIISIEQVKELWRWLDTL